MTQDQISAGCQCILKPKSQPKPTSASSKHRSRASHHPSSISSMVPQTESTGQSTISQTDSVDATSSATTTTTTMTTTTSTTTSPTANPPMCTDGPAAVDYRGLNFDGHNYTVDYEVFNTTSSVYGAQVASAQSTTFPSMVASDAATTCASWVLQQQYVMDTWNMQIAYDEGNAWWDCAFWPDRYDDSHLADYSDNNITCAYTYHEASRNQV
ncbi:hypothetical protein ANO11243_060060 [Dothideomycetidae sp. 11243]|nr:hypothetical protein ANO11243_060060 [fungal sp. No.11243]